MAKDVADRVAEEILAWIETRATQVADALLDSPLAPQVVQPSRQETIDFFRPLLILPDGTFNPAGRDQVVAQFGASAYRDIALSLARSIRAEATDQPEGPADQPDVPLPGEGGY